MSITPVGASIKVVGVGGGGGNAVDRMIQDGIYGVDYIVVNTDSQALMKSECDEKIDIGRDISHGLGAGADPSVGKKAAEDDAEQIRAHLEGADLVFVTAGEGGGTGTGAAPVVARIAREVGALTIGVVTRPFSFEGYQRAKNASTGIDELSKEVDTLIVIPNDRLLEVAEPGISVVDAYHLADEVLRNGVRGIAEVITIPGLINVDFADVRAVMENAGTAIMGIGSATGEDRAMAATEKAISSALVEAKIDGAQGVLLSFKAGSNFALTELARAADLVRESVAENANIIYGLVSDDTLGDEVSVTVIAAGFDESAKEEVPAPAGLHRAAKEAPQPEVAPEPAAPAAAPVVQGGFATPTRPAAGTVESEPRRSEYVPEIEVPQTTRGRDIDIPSFLFDEDE